MFYYPAQEETNPLGKPIQATAWNIASKGGEDGIFFTTGIRWSAQSIGVR